MCSTPVLPIIDSTNLGSKFENLCAHPDILYIIMTGKTIKCYEHALAYIRCEAPGLEPYSGGLDFELAFFRLVHKTFPKMEMIGCLFHFKKTAREKMTNLELPDEEIKIAMKRGVYDLITVLPKDELKERGVPFVRKNVDGHDF